MKIAVDAMGGDHGLRPIVEGASEAIKEFAVEIVLVGDETVVHKEIKKRGCSNPSLTVHHASQVVDMHEAPSQIARKKRDSSVWVATDLVKQDVAQAVVSAGNTGASMVSAFFLFGMTKGVERPAIAATLPTLTGTAVMLDVGANVDCTAENIEQFALMGSEYSKQVFEKPSPRVGLLSIGEEETKGNEVTKEAMRLLKACPINFVGNVEGRDVYSGEADVVVCDGFIGNVALKISEGVADTFKKMLMKEIVNSRFGKLAFLFISGPLQRLRRRMDYAEFGGAPLLGVNGITVICHGRSSSKAIKNAIRLAKNLVESRLNEAIKRDIQESHERHLQGA